MNPDRSFRSSAARLAFVYGTVVLLLVVALQGTVFLLTRSALQREIHAIVSAELEDLAEDYRDETHLPTVEDSARPYPWFPGSHEEPWWPQGHQQPACQRAQAPGRLSARAA
jgi:hypothetical protein